MAKCQHCRGCLDVIRIDLDATSEIVYYCYLCNTMFKFGNSIIEVIDSDLLDKVKDAYKKRYSLK